MMNEAISTIMTKGVKTVYSYDTLDIVRYRLIHDKIHHLPVINDKNEILGIVTSYDLLKLDIPISDYGKVFVTDIMNKKIVKVDPNDKIGTAAELLLDRRFHALPVVENKQLIGIVTSSDIMQYEFKKEYPTPILYKHVYARSHQNVLQRRAHK